MLDALFELFPDQVARRPLFEAAHAALESFGETDEIRKRYLVAYADPIWHPVASSSPSTAIKVIERLEFAQRDVANITDGRARVNQIKPPVAPADIPMDSTARTTGGSTVGGTFGGTGAVARVGQRRTFAKRLSTVHQRILSLGAWRGRLFISKRAIADEADRPDWRDLPTLKEPAALPLPIVKEDWTRVGAAPRPPRRRRPDDTDIAPRIDRLQVASTSRAARTAMARQLAEERAAALVEGVEDADAESDAGSDVEDAGPAADGRGVDRRGRDIVRDLNRRDREAADDADKHEGGDDELKPVSGGGRATEKKGVSMATHTRQAESAVRIHATGAVGAPPLARDAVVHNLVTHGLLRLHVLTMRAVDPTLVAALNAYVFVACNRRRHVEPTTLYDPDRLAKKLEAIVYLLRDYEEPIPRGGSTRPFLGNTAPDDVATAAAALAGVAGMDVAQWQAALQGSIDAHHLDRNVLPGLYTAPAGRYAAFSAAVISSGRTQVDLDVLESAHIVVNILHCRRIPRVSHMAIYEPRCKRLPVDLAISAASSIVRVVREAVEQRVRTALVTLIDFPTTRPSLAKKAVDVVTAHIVIALLDNPLRASHDPVPLRRPMPSDLHDTLHDYLRTKYSFAGGQTVLRALRVLEVAVTDMMAERESRIYVRTHESPRALAKKTPLALVPWLDGLARATTIAALAAASTAAAGAARPVGDKATARAFVSAVSAPNILARGICPVRPRSQSHR